jgi:hypothetical protein
MKHCPPLSSVFSLIPLCALAGNASAQYTDVAAGLGHSLAIRSDGTIDAWGQNNSGECNVPALATGLSYVEIEAGGATEWGFDIHFGFSIARISDGTAMAWGDNSRGQLAVPPLPPGLQYVELAAGSFHCLARLSDGTVVGWGDNTYGQCNVPSAPSGLSYVEISAGGWHHEIVDITYTWPTVDSFHPSHSVALRSDGSVVAWGSNSHGQTNVPPPAPGLTYVEVSAGSNHMAARLSDGSVVAWGDNSYGQCDVPLPPAGLIYIGIDAGGGVTTGQLSDGSLTSWGNPIGANDLPETSPGEVYLDFVVGGASHRDEWIYDFIPPDINSYAYAHTIAIRSDGSLGGWGTNSFGQASAPLGTNFCAGSVNSTGDSADIFAAGRDSLSDNQFTLRATGLPDKPFLFFYGDIEQQVPFGNGFLCVGGALVRILPVATASGGVAEAIVDLPSVGIHTTGNRKFQCWFRDPLAGNAGFNTSDGLSVTFFP